MITDFLKANKKDSTIQQHLSAFKTHGFFSFHEIKILKEVVMNHDYFFQDFWNWNWNTLTNFCRPRSVEVNCKTFAQDIMESLNHRFEYVLTDTYYLLGSYFKSSINLR